MRVSPSPLGAQVTPGVKLHPIGEIKKTGFCSCFGFEQGCQMVYSQTKNSILGNFLRGLQWKMLKYFMDIWSILQPFGILYGHLVYVMVICYIFPHFGKLYQEKSGNPGFKPKFLTKPNRSSEK
jgi:hypothetical protein